MDKYIVVKVEDADRNADYPALENPWNTNLGKIRKAIHTAAEDAGINIADTSTHSINADWHPAYMTKQESDDIARIFETAMTRAKRAYQIDK